MDEEGFRKKHRCQDVAHYTAGADKPNDGRYQVGAIEGRLRRITRTLRFGMQEALEEMVKGTDTSRQSTVNMRTSMVAGPFSGISILWRHGLSTRMKDKGYKEG